MPATTIHFVRHGEVDNPNHVLYERLSGFHLSARGVRMAQATAKYIATVPQMRGITAIYSSPLERTRETAREIENALRNIADSAYVKAHYDEDSAQSQESDIILDKRLIEAGNNFRGKRIGYGEGALWKNNNWKLVANLWKPSWEKATEVLPLELAILCASRFVSIRVSKSLQLLMSRQSGLIDTYWKPATLNIICFFVTRL